MPRARLLGFALGLTVLSGCNDATAPVAAPSSPSALNAVANSTTQITLSWVLPAGAVNEVKIGRAIGSGAVAALATLKPAPSSYVDNGLTASTAYKYQVQACNDGGCSTVREIAISTPAFQGQTALAIWNPTLPPGLAGYPYEPRLRTSGGTGGTATWSLVSGTLPSGVAFNADGTFSGTVSAAGSWPVTIRVNVGGESAQKPFTLGVVATDAARFNITRMDVQPVSAALDVHVKAAIARWEKIIVGDEHIDTIPQTFFTRPTDCGGFGQAANGTFLDDIIMIINAAPLTGNILGQATVCGVRYDNELPAIGVLTLSTTQVQPLLGTETLTNIIFHEIGHALGFGILWFSEGLNLVTPTACLSESEIGDPEFLGLNAVQEWQDAGGTANPPIEDMHGLGTACAHWRKTRFKTEVMTGLIEQVGTAQQVSRITIAAMEDSGYTVDYSAADNYRVPLTAPAGLRAPSPWTGDLWMGGEWEQVQMEPVRTLRGTRPRGM